MLYIIIITICVLLIALFNILFNNSLDYWYLYLLFSVIYTLLVIIVDAIIAIIGRRLPEKWINKDNKIYKMSKKEKKFYDFIKIRKWKDHVPELGGFTNFHKNKVEKPNDIEYIERFILEIRYGIVIHYLSVPFSFIIMIMDYKHSLINLSIGLPVAIVNMVLIVLPAFVLKYNLPKLEFILNKNIKKRNKEINEI